MKIAVYVPSWPPGSFSSGIVTYASQIVPALRQLGHEVFVLTNHKAVDEDDPYTIDLRCFSCPPTLWERAMFRLTPAITGFNRVSSPIAHAIKKLIEKHELDIFEMEETGGWNLAVSQLKLLPVVVRLHGPWFLTGNFSDPNIEIAWSRGREKREGRGIRCAQLVTAPTATMLQAVKNHYDLNLNEGRVIPNPFTAAPEAERWSLNSCDKESLLFVGRFDSLKGGDLVLHTFVELCASYPRLTLTFVGPDLGVQSTEGNTVSFEKFIRMSCPDSYRSRIKFRGQMDHSSVMSLRRKHFVTIVASQQEMMPYTVLEAMSLGCPLVTTAVGGIPDLIHNQKNGLLVAPRDVGAMAAACRKLLDNHALAERLGRQAWRDCRELYRPDNIAKQTIGAYEEANDKFKCAKTV